MPADTETSVPFLAALPPHMECVRNVFVLVPPGSDGGHETVAVVEKTASRKGKLRGLNSTPRRYQRNGTKWLLFLYDNHFGGLLCDDMGLGKTHQVPGLFCAVKEQRRADGHRRHLVVCPATVISHWLRLCTLFAPGLTVHTYYGSERSLPRSGVDVVVTSYGILKNDLPVLNESDFDIVVFDEAHTLKNRQTQGWRAADTLRCRCIFAVTGTPVQNSLSDMKALFDIILPGYLGADEDFCARFVDPIESGNAPSSVARLRTLTSPFVTRRLKKDVIKELPEKIEDIRTCRLSETQRQLYDECIRQRAAPLMPALEDRSQAIPYMHVFAVINRLKQICDHPGLVDDAWNTAAEPGQSGKFELFGELLQECLAAEHKVVVFAQYLKMIDLPADLCRAFGCEPVTLTGSTRRRGERIAAFNTDPCRRVFIGTLKAGGTGIDLTAGSVVIHYDRWWTASIEDQATDRVHRIGQSRGVLVYKLMTENTIEEHIHEIIRRKRTLADGTLPVDSPNDIKRLDREEIVSLFS